METYSLKKGKATELIHAAFNSVKLKIEELVINESYICTQYVIKSFKYLDGFREGTFRKIEKVLAEYLHPYFYRLYINDETEICIELKSENPLPPPSLLPQLAKEEFTNSTAKIPIPIGETMDGRLRIMDLADAPHLLVAGRSVEEKSEFLHSTIASLLHPRNQPCELVLIDSKVGELNERYSSVMPEIQVTLDEVLAKLKDLLETLNQRYATLKASPAGFPPIIVIVCEYDDLTVAGGSSTVSRKMSKEIETSIILLAQRGREVGIHLILATQRPHRHVITGLIKANFPTRIAFQVACRDESMNIMDSSGAELLYGSGDLLYSNGLVQVRLQGFNIQFCIFKNILNSF